MCSISIERGRVRFHEKFEYFELFENIEKRKILKRILCFVLITMIKILLKLKFCIVLNERKERVLISSNNFSKILEKGKIFVLYFD